MARTKISKAAKDFNVSIATVVDFLQKQGITIENNPNSRIDDDAYQLLIKEYKPDRELKSKSDQVSTDRKVKEAEATPVAAPAEPEPVRQMPAGPKVVGKIDLDRPGRKVEPVKAEPAKAAPAVKPAPAPAPAEVAAPAPEKVKPQPEAAAAPAKPQAAAKVEDKKPAAAEKPTETVKAAPAPKNIESPAAVEKTAEKVAEKPVETPATTDSNFIPTTVSAPAVGPKVLRHFCNTASR